MAIYQKGIMGPVSGRVGSQVAVKKNNTNYIKSRKRSYNKTPSSAQSTQRKKYERTLWWYQNLSPEIKSKLFRHYPTRLPVYQEYMKRNVGKVSSYYYLFNNYDVCQGTVAHDPDPNEGCGTTDNDVVIDFEYRCLDFPDCEPSDELYVFGIIYNLPIIYYSAQSGKRRDAGDTVEIFTDNNTANNLRLVYCFWYRPATGATSGLWRMHVNQGDAARYGWSEL
jgi:hypothetical protein